MSSFEERRRARGAWPIRRLALGDERAIDDRDSSTVDERVALVWQLTREAWALMGEPIPDYDRSEMPGALLRPRP